MGVHHVASTACSSIFKEKRKKKEISCVGGFKWVQF
jgi:hypothetical protein